MTLTKSAIDEVDRRLRDLKEKPGLRSGIELVGAIIRLLLPEAKTDPEKVELSSLSKYLRSGHKSWFKPHPVFQDDSACLSLLEPEDSGSIEANLFHLNNKRRQFIIGASHFSRNYGDQDYTNHEDNPVGIDFFLNPDGKSLQVVVTDLGRIRTLELDEKLNTTQRHIFENWQKNIDGTADQKELQKDIWDSFASLPVNKDFYGKLIDYFDSLVGYLEKNHSKDLNETEIREATNLIFNRLLFCWFLKKKETISPNDADYYFSPDSQQNDRDYYYQKLWGLFFETLNTPIGERRESRSGVD